jgi:hypothetical protein
MKKFNPELSDDEKELQFAYDDQRLRKLEAKTEIEKQQAEIANRDRMIERIKRRARELNIKLY